MEPSSRISPPFSRQPVMRKKEMSTRARVVVRPRLLTKRVNEMMFIIIFE